MPWVKPVRRSVDRLPARRPFAAIPIVWSCVEAQPGDHCERMTLARVNRDPFSGAGFAITAKLGGADWGAEQTRRTQNIRNGSGTIVSMIIKGFVAAAVSVLFVAKLISSPDRAFYWSRCILWRGGCPESKARYFARSDGAFGRKQIGRCR